MKIITNELEIKEFGLYSQSREIVKKSYRETVKTISKETENVISHTAIRNIVLKLGTKFKKLQEEKIKLYEEGKLEGNKEIIQLYMAHENKQI